MSTLLDKSEDINIGITDEQRKEITEALGHLLADSYMLYLKTHNYHWNVTGMNFQSLHGLPDDRTMVKKLQEANEAVIRTARKALPACEKAGDEATLDLVTERIRTHSKVAWMLRSHLQ